MTKIGPDVGELHPVSLAAVRFGLVDEGACPIAEPPDDVGWGRVLTEIATHGLAGLLAAAHASGDVALTDRQAEVLAERALENAIGAVTIEAALLDALDVLASLGVSVRVLKGVACAHVDYADPGWRAFNDVDLLVRGEDLDRVSAAFAAAGFRRDLPERRAAFDRRFGKDVEFNEPRGVVVDVHRTFAHGCFGLWQVVEDLWRQATPFVLGGRTVYALDPENRFLQACYSAMFGNAAPRAGQLRDLVEVATRSGIDVDVVQARATAWRCVPVVAEAFAATERLLGTRFDRSAFGWATDGGRRGDRAALRAYPNFGGSHGLAVLSGTVAIRGWGPKMAYLAGLAVPDREYRRARAASGLRPEWRVFVDGVLRRLQGGHRA